MTDQIPSSVWRELVVNPTLMRVNFRSNVVRVASMDTQKVGVQTIVTRGPANTGFWIIPGDGASPKWVQHLGTGTNVTTTHTYTGSGVKYQKWIGDLSQITYVDVASQDYSFNLSSIAGFTSLTYFRSNNCSLVEGSLSSIAGLTSLETFSCNSCSLIEGNLSSIAGLTSLTYFSGFNCPLIEGNLSSIAGLTSLTVFSCYNCSLVEGSLSSIAGLTSLTYFSCGNCSLIGGNLSSIAGLTSLVNFYCNGCPLIGGNLSSIAGLTLLVNFYCNGCSLIGGNLGSIAGLTSLVNFHCYGCTLLTYTTTTLPQWNNAVFRFDSCGLSTAEIDALIYDLYNTPIKTGGSVNLAGTNDPRTTGAPNDTIYIPALAAAGCSVTSNP